MSRKPRAVRQSPDSMPAAFLVHRSFVHRCSLPETSNEVRIPRANDFRPRSFIVPMYMVHRPSYIVGSLQEARQTLYEFSEPTADG